MKLSEIHINVGQIDGLPANPRYIEADDFEKLKMRILRMPQYLRHNPIKVEENNVILGGNMRYRALQALASEHAVATWTDNNGKKHSHIFCDEIPDEWVAHLQDYTLEDKRAIVLLDNAQNGKDDLDKLANEWNIEEINDWGNGIPDDWGADGEDIEENTAQDDLFDENEEYIETRCKAGDVWQLGNHRLMCGDSTSKSDVEILMNGAKADLVVTDPPYNVAVSNSQGMTIANDNMSSAKFGQFLKGAFGAMSSAMKDGAAFYVWFASCEHINFESALNDAGLKVHQELVWNKNQFVLGRSDYQNKYEPCLYGWKDGAAHYFFNSRKETTVIPDGFELEIDKMRKEDMRELLKKIFSNCEMDVLDFDKPTKNSDYPTMKPVELFGYLIRNSSTKGQVVLDLFGGSGTTLVCCEQMERSARIMELDPHYCDVILARWEKLTGNQAIKIE